MLDTEARWCWLLPSFLCPEYETCREVLFRLHRPASSCERRSRTHQTGCTRYLRAEKNEHLLYQTSKQKKRHLVLPSNFGNNRAFADRRGYLIISLSRTTTWPTWNLKPNRIVEFVVISLLLVCVIEIRVGWFYRRSQSCVPLSRASPAWCCVRGVSLLPPDHRPWSYFRASCRTPWTHPWPLLDTVASAERCRETAR